MQMVSEDIKDMLAADGTLGLTAGTNLFIGKEREAPDNTVTIFDTPSFAPSMSMDELKYYYSSFQIRVRNTLYDTGMTLARNIMESLYGRAGETFNGTLYTIIEATGEPALLDWDENDRPRVIINFNCQRR